MAVGAHVGAEADQLVEEHEPALEHVLGDQRGAVGDRGHGDRHRLQVGREARVGQRHHVDGGGPTAHRDPEAVLGDLDLGARA